MKNFFCLGLTVAIVLGMSLSEALARGGRGAGRGGEGRVGEGRVGGAERSEIGNRGAEVGQRAATHASGQKANNVQNKASSLQANHAAHNQPFSQGWYGNHPNAWQAAHPHADAWAVTSLAAATGWLGLAASADGGVDTTVMTADTSNDLADSSDDDSTPESTSDFNAASQLAQSGSTQATTETEFLPLGVFALAPQNQKEATAMVQISISKNGVVRGSYFDLMSDEAQTVQGAVDKKTQRVAFNVAKGKTVFETQLADLTRSQGEISLHFADGTASDWTLARFEDAPFKSDVND